MEDLWIFHSNILKQIFSALTILLINLLTIEHTVPHNKNLIAMQILVTEIDLEILSLLLNP